MKKKALVLLSLLGFLSLGVRPWELPTIPDKEAREHAMKCFTYKGMVVKQYRHKCPDKKTFAASVERFKKRTGAKQKRLKGVVVWMNRPIKVTGYETRPMHWITGLYNSDVDTVWVFDNEEDPSDTYPMLGHELCHKVLYKNGADPFLVHNSQYVMAVCENDKWDQPEFDGTLYEGLFNE